MVSLRPPQECTHKIVPPLRTKEECCFKHIFARNLRQIVPKLQVEPISILAPLASGRGVGATSWWRRAATATQGTTSATCSNAVDPGEPSSLTGLPREWPGQYAYQQGRAQPVAAATMTAGLS